MTTGNCLNIGAGKVDEHGFSGFKRVVHVDQGYDTYFCITADQVYEFFRSNSEGQRYVKSNIFDFIYSFPFKFQYIFAERIFEHMEYVSGQIGELLEALNTITTQDAKLNILVPNAALLSAMLLKYEKSVFSANDQIESLKTKLILNTEFTNMRQDPHLSIWTPRLAKEYIESEGTWRIDSIKEKEFFAGRDIYMRIICFKAEETEERKKINEETN